MPETSHFANDISHWMTDALELHRRGDLPRAEQLYRRVLEREPAHADALHFLGVLAAQAGHPGPALGLIEQAITLDPTAAHYVVNRGNVLRQLGRLDEAVDAYLAALLISPTHVSAYVNLANGLRQLRRLDEAANAARAAVRLQEDEAELHYLLGVILLDRREHEEAIASLERAVALRPDFPDALGNLERARAGEPPTDSVARSAPESGVPQAEVIDPAPGPEIAAGAPTDLPGALGDADETAPAAWPAPEVTDAVSSVSTVDEPVTAIDLPAPPEVATDSGGVPASPLILAGSAAAADAPDSTTASPGSPPPPPPSPPSAAEHSARLLALQHVEHDLKKVFEEHRRWNELHAAALTRDAMPHFVDMDPDRRLRVGFVSPAITDPAIARFVEPLVERHDRAAMEIYCYAHGMADASRAGVVTRLAAVVDEWHGVAALSNAELAAKCRDHRIDILVDLAGHTPGNRLLAFARGAAPVQATWLGYPDTTGMTAIGHRLTDAIVDPPGHPSGAFSTESLLRLDDCFLCLRLRDDDDRPAIERNRRRRVVFGCFADDPAKASPEAIALWGRVLRVTPGSRLVLVSPAWEDAARLTGFRALLRRHGVPSDRVELLAAATPTERLALFNRIDIALDTYPHCDGAAACDALSMGVPVITRAGQSRASRLTASVLTAAGFANYVATNADEYVSIASSLAAQGVRSLEQRREQREWVAASVLCDDVRFAKKLQDAIRRMWRDFCAG